MKPAICYVYRGQVERGTGEPGYAWHPGYSEDNAEGQPTAPWMTMDECRADAKARGCRATFAARAFSHPNKPTQAKD